MTLSLFLSILALACATAALYYRLHTLQSLRDENQFQQIYIDALKRQLEAAERIIQRGLYDEETLRRK